MEYAPGIVQGIAFGEVPSPLERAEGAAEAAVGLAAVHQAHLGIKDIAVIEGGLLIGRQVFLGHLQGLAQLVDAPVIIGIFQRTGRILGNIHVAGNVAQGVIVLPAQAAGRAHRRVHGMGAVGDGLPEFADIVVTDAGEVGVGHHGGAVVAHHAAPVARRSPFGQETAFQIVVHQAFLHLGRHFRIQEVQQREQAAEGIPEAGVRIEMAVLHLAGVGAVVLQHAEHAHFGQVPGEEQAPVQAGIEGAQMVYVVIFHLNLAQGLVPGRLGEHLHLLEGVVHFSQIQLGLGHADERGRHLHMYHLSFGGGERNHADILGGLFRREGRVGLDDDVIAEIRGHAAVVVHGPGLDGMVVHNFHLAALIGIHHQVRLLALGVGETEPGGMGGRHQLGRNVMVGQVDAVIVRLGHLCLVGEPAGAFFLVIERAGSHRHQAEGAVVINPGRRLMRLLEAADVRGVVTVGPSVSVLSGLGSPEMGAPGNGDGRIGVAGREVEGGQGAPHGVHVFCPVSQGTGRIHNRLGAGLRQ